MEYIDINKIEKINEFDNFLALDEISAKDRSIYKELGDSVMNHGIINPFLVQKCKNNGNVKLIDGYKRLRVISELIKEKRKIPNIADTLLPIEYVDDSIEPIIIRFTSNVREPKRRTEAAKIMFDLLKRYNVKKNELAHRSGFNAYHFMRYARLERCIPEIRTLIDKDRVSFAATKYFIILNEKGQKNIYNQIKNIECVTKSTVEKLVYKLPQKYFIKSKEERDRISAYSKHGKQKRRFFDAKAEKRILSDELSDKVAEREILYKERERYVTNLEKLLGKFDLLFRIVSIKNYIKTKYPAVFNDLSLIFQTERNKDIN